MRDGFAAVGTVVDHKAEAFGEAQFLCQDAGGEQQVAERSLVGGRGFADARNEFFRDDEQVHGGLRLNVVEDDAEVVFVFDLRGDLAVDDALEDGFGHVARLPTEHTEDTEEFSERENPKSRCGPLQKQQLQVGAADGAGGGEGADEGEGFFVIALPPRGGAAGGRDERGAKIRDEERGLAEGREFFQPGHDLGAREEGSGGGEGERGVPVVKAVARKVGEEFREEIGGGGVERGVVGGGEFGVRGGLRFEFGEAERDRGLDLIGEVKVVPGDVREEGVDKMQAAQVVAGGGGHGGNH